MSGTIENYLDMEYSIVYGGGHRHQSRRICLQPPYEKDFDKIIIPIKLELEAWAGRTLQHVRR